MPKQQPPPPKYSIRVRPSLEILDVEKNQSIRKIQIRGPETGRLNITLNENILASRIRGGMHRGTKEPNSSIFIHDIEELLNPNISSSDLWMKTLEYPVFDDVSGVITANFFIAINSSSLFAISGCGCQDGHKRIYIWDFLNNKDGIDSVPVKCPEKSSLLNRFKSWTRKV